MIVTMTITRIRLTTIRNTIMFPQLNTTILILTAELNII